jgi:cystathionine gamma-synthase
MTQSKLPTSTQAVQAGEPKVKPYDALPTPIVQTSTYAFADTQEIIDHTEGTHPRADREEYGRYGNPTCRAVELRLAALEGTEDALLFASGMAAVTTTVLALVKKGQHVVFFRDCYRQTRQFITGTLAGFGVESTLLEAGDLAGLASAIRPETRLVVSESPTNPYLSCMDLAELARICRERAGGKKAVKTLIDATFATPINCQPAAFGIDLIVHSATKYLAGHNDVLAGALCGNSGLVSVVRDLRGVLGSVCDPHAAFLVGRGMKTLALRVERQNASAQLIAEHLERHPAIEQVYYPGLASHRDHAIAKAQMRGFGGVVSFVVKGGLEAARHVVDRTPIARIGPSFGGVETLIEPPAIMSYYEMTPEQRREIGIQEGLVRLAVGIEDAADIIRDLDRALASLA